MTAKPQLVPCVSICMPTYNGADFIQPAIESVLAQTFVDWELIVIDDASTDGTAELVAAYSDPRIRLIRNDKNLGFQPNWNRCFGETRGEFIKFLPDDDLIAPRCLETQVEALRAEPRAALAACRRNIIDQSGIRRGIRGVAKDRLWQSQDAIRMIVRSGANPLGEPGAILFRRELAARVGSFVANLWVLDVDYWVRLLELGMVITFKEPLASFRVSKNSTSVYLRSDQAALYWSWVLQIAVRFPFLRPVDLWMARAMSQVTQLARSIFYKVFIQ